MKKFSRRKVVAAAAGLGAALVLPMAAMANGDAFFEATEIQGDPQFVYFGSVKDRSGQYVVGARVTVEISEPVLSYETYTNILGRFRSDDVGRVIQELGYKIDPNKIKATVYASGYKVVRMLSMRRSSDTVGAFEINFVVEKVDDDEAAKAG